MFFFIITTFPRTNLRPEQFPTIIIGKGELKYQGKYNDDK